MRDIRNRTNNALRESVSHLASALFRRVVRVHAPVLRRLRMSAVEANVLVVLFVRGSLAIGELQRELGIASATLTEVLDRMEAKELVRRQRSEADRRSLQITPVQWGAARRNAFIDSLLEVEDHALRGLSAAERKELARLLRKAIASTDEEG